MLGMQPCRMCSRPEESELGGTGLVEHVWPMCCAAVIDAKCQPRTTRPAHPVTQFEARDASVPMASNHPAAQGTPVATRSEAGGTTSAMCLMHETQVRPSAAACQGDNCSNACGSHVVCLETCESATFPDDGATQANHATSPTPCATGSHKTGNTWQAGRERAARECQH